MAGRGKHQKLREKISDKTRIKRDFHGFLETYDITSTLNNAIPKEIPLSIRVKAPNVPTKQFPIMIVACSHKNTVEVLDVRHLDNAY